MAGYVYPDGLAVLDQPLVLLDAFRAIANAKAEVTRAPSDRPA
jgi:hypothetical protein